MQTISGFMNFTQAFIITTEVHGQHIVLRFYLYQSAFNYFEMGYASAMAWVLSLLWL